MMQYLVMQPENMLFSPMLRYHLLCIPGKKYFDPILYTGGFKVYEDDSSSLLLSADLTFHSLTIDGSVGRINAHLMNNLTNMNSPLNSGVSRIADQFINSPLGGAVNITLQSTLDLGTAIQSGERIISTYSGSATPVPEPSSCLLFFFSILGIAGIKILREN